MGEGKVEAIASDLKSLVEGKVLSDDLSRTIYSSGACIYSVRPMVIVQPRHREDVVKCVRYAAKNGIPLTARGGGTGRAGQGIGEGIILDFMRYMNQVLGIDPEKKWVRVQPGVILGRLNAVLKPMKKFFPIDPSTTDYCAIGGMIANNSSGPHAIKYGATRDYVESLEVVLSTGEVIQTGPRALAGFDSAGGKDQREKKIYAGVLDLVNRYAGPLRDEKPETMKNSCGYDLWQVRRNGSLDLTPLLVGSEGTLGIFTEAKIRLADPGGKTHSALIYFNTLDTVGKATVEILKFSPTMLEIMENTQNDDTFARTVEVIKQKARIIRSTNTVCEPTRDHQRETIDLARQVDLMVVVGGRHSANTCRLADLAAQEGPRVLHIETEAELQRQDFDGYTTVGVTAGASTPEWMINRVVEKLEAFNPETSSRISTWLKHLMGMFVASNIYAGLGAASLTLAASLLLHPPLSRDELWPLMVTAGLFILAMHTVNRYQERSHYSGWGTFSPRSFQRFQQVMLWVGIVALMAALGMALSLGVDQFLALAAFGILGALYGVKIVPISWARHIMGIRRLKDLPASRDIGTALGWTVAAGIIPLQTVGSLSTFRAAGVLGLVFLLVFLRSALIGVRDVQGDKIMGMETIFKVVGKRRTKAVLISVVAALTILLLGLTFPWRGLPLAGFLFTVVPYMCGVSWLYHQRLLPKGAAGEILVDGQFLLAGVMALVWHLYR